MTMKTILLVMVFLGTLLALAHPLGSHIAKVFQGRRTFLHPLLEPVERLILRLLGVDPSREMDWKTYTVSLILFGIVGGLALYLLQRVQGVLPANPAGMKGVSPDLAFNTAVSFVTNTNWQAYAGESTLSYLTQMLGLTVQNFLSAAKGLAVLVALIRGFTRHSTREIGNFWVDLVRGTLYVLLPFSLILALALAGQGVVQTLGGPAIARVLDAPVQVLPGFPQGAQIIARGPAASQVAIKLLGTNGGGFFNANSAHPLENPTPVSNFLEMLAILIIPAALCRTFGCMVGDARQGRVLLAVMLLLFTVMAGLCIWSESQAHPGLMRLGIDQHMGVGHPGGNMEGKEVRFGIPESALFTTITTATSCGAVNCMHDSLTPLGGLVPLWLMQLGEVVFGGVGAGLAGMLIFAVVAVFVAGLMVGRTPEYLGKKIEAFEMKMAALILLTPVLLILTGTALAVCLPAGTAGITNPGPHGFSQVIYAFSSTANNNGSAFAGLSACTPFYNILLGLVMLAGRYWVIIFTLALAGSLAAKKRVPAGEGTLSTGGPLFAVWLTVVVVMVGALSFLPALALGPIAEHLLLR